MKCSIEIHNVGKTPQRLKVYDSGGKKRDVEFNNHTDAEEAVRIIRRLRIDSAFIQAVVVKA